MRFDDNTILELKSISFKIAMLLQKYNDAKSEENEFLRDIRILIDGAVLESRKEKIEITIDTKDLLKLKESANAYGLSINEAIEYLICKHNKRSEKDGSFWSSK